MGSILLLYVTQTRVPHCSHSQLNDGVGGNGTSSTRGQASTSRNSKFGMYERYTRNLFGSCDKFRKRKNSISLTSIPQSRGLILKCGSVVWAWTKKFLRYRYEPPARFISPPLSKPSVRPVRASSNGQCRCSGRVSRRHRLSPASWSLAHR